MSDAFNWGMMMNILGGTFNAYGQFEQGAAMKDHYDFQARQIERQGEFDAKRVRENVKGFSASQKAAMAANGISIDSVSAQDVLDDTAKKGALDELLIMHNVNVEAWNARYQGKMAKAAGMTGAANTLLGTAGQVSDSWTQYQRTGAGGEKVKVPKKVPKDLPRVDGTGRRYGGFV